MAKLELTLSQQTSIDLVHDTKQHLVTFCEHNKNYCYELYRI